MGSVLFSTFVGLVTVIVLPMMIVGTFADIYRSSTRKERLQLWQASILVSTTGLMLWTYFWVRTVGEVYLIAETPLWVFCGVGVVLSVILGGAQGLLTLRQRKLEARLIEAVLQP